MTPSNMLIVKQPAKASTVKTFLQPNTLRSHPISLIHLYLVSKDIPKRFTIFQTRWICDTDSLSCWLYI